MGHVHGWEGWCVWGVGSGKCSKGRAYLIVPTSSTSPQNPSHPSSKPLSQPPSHPTSTPPPHHQYLTPMWTNDSARPSGQGSADGRGWTLWWGGHISHASTAPAQNYLRNQPPPSLELEGTSPLHARGREMVCCSREQSSPPLYSWHWRRSFLRLGLLVVITYFPPTGYSPFPCGAVRGGGFIGAGTDVTGGGS